MKIAKWMLVIVAVVVTEVALFSDHFSQPAQASSLLNRKAPSIDSPQWLNSKPLHNSDLKGKVFLVEFWTFDCWNCKNVEPYVKRWYEKYRGKGFEVIAVHAPEFSHEKKISNVRKYLEKNAIRYPVAIDNNFTIWRRYKNRYWPAMYLVDKQGKIRYSHFGEGRYRQTEAKIQTLLGE